MDGRVDKVMKMRKALPVAIMFPVLMHLYLYTMSSHLSAYNRIGLGTSRYDVVHLLVREGTDCWEVSGRERGNPNAPYIRCIFRDPWREYQVIFEKGSGLVISKRMYYARPVLGENPFILGRVVQRSRYPLLLLALVPLLLVLRLLQYLPLAWHRLRKVD